MTDEDLKRLAERYVSGEDAIALAFESHLTDATFKRMLKMAKAMFPDLDWSRNRADWAQKGEKSTNQWTEMKDGKPGSRGVPQGSIVKSRGK